MFGQRPLWSDGESGGPDELGASQVIGKSVGELAVAVVMPGDDGSDRLSSPIEQHTCLAHAGDADTHNRAPGDLRERLNSSGAHGL